MKHGMIKILACLSLALMVFSALTPGALADETGKEEKEENACNNHRMMHGPYGGPAKHPHMGTPVFETDEEKMGLLTDKHAEHINRRIEMLQEMMDKVDEIENENITEESIQEHIDELEALLTEIENVTSMDELKEIMEEARENEPRPRGNEGECRSLYPLFKEGIRAE